MILKSNDKSKPSDDVNTQIHIASSEPLLYLGILQFKVPAENKTLLLTTKDFNVINLTVQAQCLAYTGDYSTSIRILVATPYKCHTAS